MQLNSEQVAQSTQDHAFRRSVAGLHECVIAEWRAEPNVLWAVTDMMQAARFLSSRLAQFQHLLG